MRKHLKKDEKMRRREDVRKREEAVEGSNKQVIKNKSMS
jgi:hypothetical protein